MKTYSPNSSWKTARYRWKKRIKQSLDLTGKARLLGLLLCDEYANAKTGVCWPGNARLASELNTSVRSVQRHLADLMRFGWLCYTTVPGKRRALLLTFPPGEHDSEHDNKHDTMPTNVTLEHDKTVVPYIEPRNEPRKIAGNQAVGKAIGTVLVSECEQDRLDDWRAWMGRNLKEHPEAVLQSVKSANGFNLPKRFPPTSPEDTETARAYFAQMLNMRPDD